jgi:hypothetical protein
MKGMEILRPPSPARTRRAAGALLAGMALAAAAPAADDPCRVPDAPRVVAVGDVHGSYDNLAAVLRFTGLTDAKDKWAGGKAHLVQTGDLLDRGTEGRKVLDLLMRLEGEARKAGGRVHALLGNHEVMNMLGDLRYVSAEEYKTWQEPESTRRREHAYEAAVAQARRDAKAAGQPFDEDAFHAKFLQQVPLGYLERNAALSAEGRYGRWLRERPVVARVNGVAFVHGGLTAEVAALGCEAINAQVHRELTDDFAKSQQAPQGTLAAGEKGPLWYRGLAKDDESILAPQVDQVLRSLGARAIVVGHSVTGDGRIQARFGGRVIGIDAGMGEVYGSHLAALEVGADGSLTALYPDRREELVPATAKAARAAPRPAPFGYSRIRANASR